MITVLVYKKCGSKETEVSEVEKHLFKKKQVEMQTRKPAFFYIQCYQQPFFQSNY